MLIYVRKVGNFSPFSWYSSDCWIVPTKKRGSILRKYLLAAAAAAAIATPAVARDHSGYVGLEGGAMFPTKSNLHIDASDSSYFGYYLYNYTGTYTPTLKTKYKTG